MANYNLGISRQAWISTIISAFVLQACSSGPKPREFARPPVKAAIGSPMTAPVGESLEEASPQEAADYQDIETLYSKNLYESAEAKMNSFARRHRHSVLLPTIENLRGLMLLRQKKTDQAILHFQKAIRLNPKNEPFNQYVLYNLARAEFDLNQIDESQKTVNDIQPNSLDKGNRLKLHFLKASIYQKKSIPLEASRQLLTAGYLITDSGVPENKKVIYKLLDQSLQSITDIAALESLFQEFEDSPLSDSLLFRLGSQEIAVGNRGNAEIHLRALIQKYPEGPYFLQATELLNSVQIQTSIQSRAIGVLLPMKGKFAKFGMKSLQGIQMAFGIFDSNEPDSKMSLIVEDSGEESEQMIKALDRLVLKHHVAAVIGPMLSKGVEQVAQRAQELGVPLISLARKSGPNQDYVFQAGLTQQIQAYEVARFAIEQLGAKRFAVIYPNEKFGIDISHTFWDAVESMGGKIVGSEYYNPGETDFRQVIDKLSGLYYSGARQRELDLLAQERDANHITKRTRKTEQFYQLKPIVDYDAVFIPDEPKVAGQILPTFAYRDVDHVRFLGTSAWNSPDFISRAQSYGEHATFVDAYFADSKSQTSKNFTTHYKAVFGQDPTSFEALAYDAASLLKFTLSSSSSNLSRSDIRDRLKSIRDFQGVTGKITYRDGQFFRNLTVLTVKNGHFAEFLSGH